MSPYDLWTWPWTSTVEFYQRLLDSLGETTATADGAQTEAALESEIEWLTPNSVTLDLHALRLREFSNAGACPDRKTASHFSAAGSKGTEAPLLVVAPRSLHDAGFLDLAPGHSLVQTLSSSGCERLFLVEWKSATQAMRDDGVDAQLALLNIAIDEIGPPADLVGVCQGGWLSLVYATRFPGKIRKLVLAGSPIDTKAAPSALCAPGAPLSEALLEQLLRLGEGLVLGRHLSRLWPSETRSQRLTDFLQLSAGPTTPAERALAEKFERWDRRLLDLPGAYYREVALWLYRENRLIAGTFPALGRTVDLGALSCPLFLLAGAEDTIVPPAQVLAVASRVPADLAVETAIAPCCHLALFMGRRTLTEQWPGIVAWLSE